VERILALACEHLPAPAAVESFSSMLVDRAVGHRYSSAAHLKVA
jgi:hypothetical protein